MSKSLTDEQLVTQLHESNKRAFEEIYERYWYKLFCISYHQVGSREEAEELVHDIFESLWNRRQESGIRNLNTYLMISMKYRIANFIKSRITWRKYREYLILNKIQENYATDEIVDFSDLSKAIDQVMSRLPEKTSRVFQLSRFEHQSVKAIAEELNISEKAVEYHITKSLKALKDGLWMYQSSN
ncbi:RNA polymerase sigma factor [Dyadobacter sediminis]|uniref:Sigma-70 family RNA polymerase sigma factor n=1 Tax=Dyadobacter sediminis TaxID=1493691 RepID=A0A5R9KC71_9BACT|nr:sigma-70 family RNA polymerase sigma factor [Dyadobacter sediminis]TLU92329.1 sigma-70 family RNA polymerase sigma factor [Dyadobacter sediminis]GGB95366.1 DNA-directed RNA polymerase sigma-70 factor [Dyadobacter sediminis]